MKEMKTPIWKIANRQVLRILRYSEAKEIITNIEMDRPKDAPWAYDLPVSKATVQVWIQALLFTGMRFHELAILHSHPELFQEDGTLRLDKNAFYDVGKKKQTNKERIVYLSDMGIPVIAKFFDVPALSEDPNKAYHYLNSVLRETGKKLEYPERTIQYREKRTIGIEEVEKNGKKKIIKKTSPIESQLTTNGLSVRVFRKTWNSWLVNYFKGDPYSLTLIEMSMGHTDHIAVQHYLTLQFDEYDIKDIERAVKGFGVHTGWREKKENLSTDPVK